MRPAPKRGSVMTRDDGSSGFCDGGQFSCTELAVFVHGRETLESVHGSASRLVEERLRPAGQVVDIHRECDRL